jgi:catechol 2,3-dioxygenase-like lactoylglutathione lyase family enzyme
VSALGALTLFVDDVAAARDWYARVLDAPEHYSDDVSVVFDLGGTLINLLQESEAPEVIEPTAVAPRTAGARALMTISVADVDAEVARLAAVGVPLHNGPVDRPWGVRTAVVADPAGHLWEFAAPIPVGG